MIMTSYHCYGKIQIQLIYWDSNLESYEKMARIYTVEKEINPSVLFC